MDELFQLQSALEKLDSASESESVRRAGSRRRGSLRVSYGLTAHGNRDGPPSHRDGGATGQ
jgi:hypothetical protein